MRKEEIHLIQGDIIHATKIIVDLKVKATVTIQKLLSQTLSTTPNTTPKILNHSSYNFSNIPLSVLRYSTKFTWTKPGSLLNYKNDLNSFTKKNQLKKIFNDTEYEDESIARNKSTKNFETKSRESSLIINEIKMLIPNPLSYQSSFIQEKYSAFQSLKEIKKEYLKQ